MNLRLRERVLELSSWWCKGETCAGGISWWNFLPFPVRVAVVMRDPSAVGGRGRWDTRERVLLAKL